MVFYIHKELWYCIIINCICHNHCYLDVSPTSGLTYAENIWHNYDLTYSACNSTGRREPTNGRMGKTTNWKTNGITVITLPKWYRKEFDRLSLNLQFLRWFLQRTGLHSAALLTPKRIHACYDEQGWAWNMDEHGADWRSFEGFPAVMACCCFQTGNHPKQGLDDAGADYWLGQWGRFPLERGVQWRGQDFSCRGY